MSGSPRPDCRLSKLSTRRGAHSICLQGTVQLFNGQPQLRIQQLNALQPDQVECAAEFLPHRRCPEEAPSALKCLIDFERSLPDPAIGVPLLRCRASVAHHHSQVGGLLLHSTAALDIAANLARRALPTDARRRR